VKRISTCLSIVILAVGIAGGTACQRGPDVRKSAEEALERENIRDVNLDWDNEARVLHMKGEVDTDQTKARAEQVAARAVGTSGQVANELTLKGVDANTADDLDGTLRSHISNMFEEDPELKERDINVDVNNGVVTLKGNVESVQERERAYQIASQVPGAREVVNSLEIEHDDQTRQPGERSRP
jgi:osmotically-inducible protein OsmY